MIIAQSINEHLTPPMSENERTEVYALLETVLKDKKRKYRIAQHDIAIVGAQYIAETRRRQIDTGAFALLVLVSAFFGMKESVFMERMAAGE